MEKYGKKGIVLGIVILFVGVNMSFLVGAGAISAQEPYEFFLKK